MQRLLREHLVQPVPDPRVDDAIQFGLHLGAVPVPYGLDQQVAQGPFLEGVIVTEHVEQVSVVRHRHLFDLREQPCENIAFAGVLGHHVPQVTDLALTDAVDTSKALLYPVRIPRQVVVDHQVGALQVEPLPRGVRGEQHHRVGVVGEFLTRRHSFLAAGAAVDPDHRVGAAELGADSLIQVVEGVPVLGEDDDFPRRPGAVAGQ